MSWYFSFGFLPFPSLPSPGRHITVFSSAFVAKYPIRNAATEKRTTKRTTMKTSRRRVDRLLTPEISSSILALLTFKLRSLNFLIRSNALRNIFLSSRLNRVSLWQTCQMKWVHSITILIKVLKYSSAMRQIAFCALEIFSNLAILWACQDRRICSLG